jgi:3-isopropylmalate/(R)-2-methylmalate dehydratase large subunit
MTGRKVRAPEKTLAVVDHNVPTTDRSKGIADEEAASRSRRSQERQGLRRRSISTRTTSARASSTSSARAGLHAAGHDHRLRRQPHLDARRLRRARHGIGTSEVEHVLATQTLIQKKAKNMLVRVDGKLPRRHRQGHHPRHHRRDRHRRRHRPRHRIRRRGDPRAVDGRPHDRLQHDDRGRRPRRPDRAGREDLRLSQGPAAGAEGRAWDAAMPTGRRCTPTKARISTSCARRRQAAADRHLGHLAREDVVSITGVGARSREHRRTSKRAAMKRALDYMGLRPAPRSPTSRSTASSSAPAPMAASRTCARSPRSSRARRSATVSAMIVPGSGLVKEQAEAEGLDKIFKPPASNGASRAARCASA